jgi:hypothetical protein
MPDMFESVKNKWKDSPSILVLYFLAWVMFIIGINHFIEDTWSSYLGLIDLEKYFQMNVQIFDWTYWTMSIAPQVAGMVFFYIYLSDTKKLWALWASGGSQLIDLSADVWYRSNGQAFSNAGATVGSILLTFIFFTIGCEAFISIGAGLILRLSKPAKNMLNLLGENTPSRPSYTPPKKSTSKPPKYVPSKSHPMPTKSNHGTPYRKFKYHDEIIPGMLPRDEE